MRFNSYGELETMKLDDWLALRERMRRVRRAGAGEDTPYLRILRRFVPEYPEKTERHAKGRRLRRQKARDEFRGGDWLRLVPGAAHRGEVSMTFRAFSFPARRRAASWAHE